MRGGVHRYAAQVSLPIDAATAEKSRFRMETRERPMDSIRFADVLFTIVVLAITFGILYLVHQARKKVASPAPEDVSAESSEEDEDS